MNISELGITISNPEAFVSSILSETGLTKEEAFVQLANQLGVGVTPAREERVVELTKDDQEVLKKASDILTRVFSA